jgi:predicted transcriptional regulator
MNPKKNTVAVTFRCDVAVADQLDELCRMMGIKRSEFLISAITSEYDKMQGNPKLKDMLEQFKQITETMKQMTGQANAGTPVGIGDGAGGEGEA